MYFLNHPFSFITVLMFFLFDHVCTLLCDIVSFEEKSDIYNKNNEMGFFVPSMWVKANK